MVLCESSAFLAGVAYIGLVALTVLFIPVPLRIHSLALPGDYDSLSDQRTIQPPNYRTIIFSDSTLHSNLPFFFRHLPVVYGKTVPFEPLFRITAITNPLSHLSSYLNKLANFLT